MAGLVLGPLLRYVDESSATVWVETDAACEVEVAGAKASTFGVGGHHYALVVIEGLEPGCCIEYQVRLDGEVAWPEPNSTYPPSRIRTRAVGGRELRLFVNKSSGWSRGMSDVGACADAALAAC